VNRIIKEYEDAHFASEKARLLMEEHNLLQHLLDLEYTAADLVSEAQAEAERRISEREKQNNIRYDRVRAGEIEIMEKSYAQNYTAIKENYQKQLDVYHQSLKTQSVEIGTFSSMAEKFLLC
jgi:regulator of protease activity HflC (stomatin/prohibitin superfamily)